jgi:predicted ArsR family transcriptional regulator
LKTRISVLESEIQQLESEKLRIEEEKSVCQAHLDKIHNVSLNKKYEKILITIASHSGQRAQIISQHSGITENEVSEKLNYLETLHLVTQKRGGVKNPNGGFPLAVQVWYLSEQGHVYINANELHSEIT